MFHPIAYIHLIDAFVLMDLKYMYLVSIIKQF